MLIWTGTAEVTNGLTTVTTASGGALTDEVARHSSMAVLDGVVYFVDSLTDTSTFDLTRAYAGTDGTVSLEVWPVSRDVTNLVDMTARLARTQAQLNVLDKNSQGLFYSLLGVTGAADPGPGMLAFDNADPASATEAYIDVIDANGRPVSGLLGLMEPGTTVIVRSLASTAYRAFAIASTSNEGGWFRLGTGPVGHDGVLGDTEALSVFWLPAAAGLEINATGQFADRSTHDDAAGGFVFLSADGDGDTITASCLFRKASATSGDWGPAVPFQGPQGDKGWSPLFSAPADGERRVLRLTDWTGGAGTKPTAGVGQYLGAGGLVTNIANASEFRGVQGLSAYQVAVVNGYAGTEPEWLDSLVGASAYQIAVDNGFVGDQAAWLLAIRGVDGTDPGALYDWDEGTTDEDPGLGKMRADSADLSAATMLMVSKTGRTGDDLSVFLLGIRGSSNAVKGIATLTSSGGNAQATANVTGVIDQTNYVKIVLQPSSHSGATGFVGAAPISLQFNRAGDQGSTDLLSLASAVGEAASKSVPADGDRFLLLDSEDGDSGKTLSFADLIASLDFWAMQPIGVPIPLQSNLAGVAAPPTDRSYRYIKLTASDAYNTGVLTSESVSGSAPLVQATAVINDAASPLVGETVRLINTERRFLRAGSAGSVQNDQMQQIIGDITRTMGPSNASGAFSLSGTDTLARGTGTAIVTPTITLDSADSPDARTGNETRAKNIGADYYMRIR